MVQPYYPRYLKPEHPRKRVIDAGWAHKKRYVVPTPKQAQSTALLVEWLTSDAAVGLKTPRHWISLRKEHLAMGRAWNALLPKPGIYLHTAFGDADGAWLVLYSWLRLEGGFTPEAVYPKAVHLETGARRNGLLIPNSA